MERGEPGSLEYFRWFYLGDWGEPGGIEERWHPDLELNQSAALFDTQGTFHGYEGLRAVFEELAESFGGIVWEPVEVQELDGGRYLVRVVISGHGKGSGISLDGEIGHIFTLRDDRAARLDVYWEWEQAREAAGLG
jgi:ketosteroid isomerase-like protein